MTRDPVVGWGVGLLRDPGRAAALALVAGALVLRIIDPGIITELRVRGFDLVEQVWPRASDSARVAIVDIDEKSLAQYGQWPWPWHLVAKLVRRIAQGHPRVRRHRHRLRRTRSAFAGRDRARTARPASGFGGRVGATAAGRPRPRRSDGSRPDGARARFPAGSRWRRLQARFYPPRSVRRETIRRRS